MYEITHLLALCASDKVISGCHCFSECLHFVSFYYIVMLIAVFPFFFVETHEILEVGEEMLV